jgi:hypothetical protein
MVLKSIEIAWTPNGKTIRSIIAIGNYEIYPRKAPIKMKGVGDALTKV